MMLWMKARLTTVIIAAVAVFTVAGASAVFAAQSHNDSPAATRTSAGASSQQAQGFEAQGVIQQITFDQGTTTSGSLVFLPNGKQSTVTVVFTTATHIEVGEGNSGDSSHDQNDDNGNDNAQQGALQAGMTVKIEGTVQADGSILAREINANAQDANDNDDNNNNNDQEDHRLTGVIQSIDQGAQTFVLLPDGQTTPVTIAFDAQTRVDEDSQDGGKHSALTVGEHARVEVVTRADGSLYAKEIQPASGDDSSGDHNGDNSGSGDGGGSGSGSGSGGGSGGSGSDG
ncbi:MAG TPA: DUF5666 domain-containing protein [Ktedonobacterales bacterium]|jgi:uncharacterized membrane protein YgcG